MKKLNLLFLFALFSLLLQNCKKSSTDDTTTTTTALLTATVNASTWTPDTLGATIVYNAAAKTKTLTISATKSQKRIVMTYVQSAAANSNTFTLGNYTIDATGNPSMVYSVQQLTASGYAFVPMGEAGFAAGSIVVTAIDVTNKTITGTFSFTSKKANYDSNGEITSIDAATITGGSFNAMPYTFTSN